MTTLTAQRLAHRPKDRPGVRSALRIGAVLSATIAVVAAAPTVLTLVRDSAPPATYDSCVALTRDFPTGVGTVAAVDGLVQRRLPVMDDRAYRANARLDTDADGIACERR